MVLMTLILFATVVGVAIITENDLLEAEDFWAELEKVHQKKWVENERLHRKMMGLN